MTLSLTLQEKSAVTDRISLFRFVAADGAALPCYTPGAHVEFDLGEAGKRSYSLVDFEPVDFAPAGDAPGSYTFAVQREDDGQGGSRAMHGLEVGATVSAAAPKNDFELHGGDAPALLLAGGIGATPIISFAAELTRRGADFAFHYCTRSADLAAFRGELVESFGDHLQFWADDSSPADLAALIGAAPDGAHIYCCGPRGMIDAVRAECENAGIPGDHVHFELFTTPDAQEGDQPFEVEISGTGQVFTIPAGTTIVERSCWLFDR